MTTTVTDKVTLPAIDFEDVLDEGCALVLTRDLVDTHGGSWLAGTEIVYLRKGGSPNNPITEIPAAITLADVAIDLTRASGQWAVACWLEQRNKVVPDTGNPGRDLARFIHLVSDALRGKADPAELRRVALEVRRGH